MAFFVTAVFAVSVLASIVSGALLAIPSPAPQASDCDIKSGTFRSIKGEVSTAGQLAWRTMAADENTAQVDIKAPGFERRGIVLPVGDVRIFVICGKEVSMKFSWRFDTMTISVF